MYAPYLQYKTMHFNVSSVSEHFFSVCLSQTEKKSWKRFFHILKNRCCQHSANQKELVQINLCGAEGAAHPFYHISKLQHYRSTFFYHMSQLLYYRSTFLYYSSTLPTYENTFLCYRRTVLQYSRSSIAGACLYQRSAFLYYGSPCLYYIARVHSCTMEACSFTTKPNGFATGVCIQEFVLVARSTCREKFASFSQEMSQRARRMTSR